MIIEGGLSEAMAMEEETIYDHKPDHEAHKRMYGGRYENGFQKLDAAVGYLGIIADNYLIELAHDYGRCEDAHLYRTWAYRMHLAWEVDHVLTMAHGFIREHDDNEQFDKAVSFLLGLGTKAGLIAAQLVASIADGSPMWWRVILIEVARAEPTSINP